jgi:integrase
MHRERELLGVGDPNKHTVKTYLDGWVAHLKARGDHSVTTLAGYARNARIASHHIGDIQLERLAPMDLDRLYAKVMVEGGAPRKDGLPRKPLSRQSTLGLHRLLHTALRQAEKWRLIALNPARDATPPSVPFKQQRGYRADEVTKLFEAAGEDPEGQTMLALLLTTGIRRSELCGLTLDNLDLDAGTIRIERTVVEARGFGIVVREVTKSDHSRRTLGIPANVVSLLRQQKARVLEQALAWGKEYHDGPRYLFPAAGGGPLDPMVVTVKLRQFRRRAGIEGVQPVHGLRHSAASLLVASGADVKSVQHRLGHSTPTITLRLYTDVVAEKDRAAGETLGGFIPIPRPA